MPTRAVPLDQRVMSELEESMASPLVGVISVEGALLVYKGNHQFAHAQKTGSLVLGMLFEEGDPDYERKREAALVCREAAKEQRYRTFFDLLKSEEEFYTI